MSRGLHMYTLLWARLVCSFIHNLRVIHNLPVDGMGIFSILVYTHAGTGPYARGGREGL